ncbi:MAG: hypothetical protein DCC46_09775 [Armatimonadetes bacterium]|nr:MAG: hypothetical protein DCC46_09775 [Armatimonadota bacterium]
MGCGCPEGTWFDTWLPIGNGVGFVAAIGVGPGHRVAKSRVATLQAAFPLGAGLHQGVALRFSMSARWACRIADVHLERGVGSVPEA